MTLTFRKRRHAVKLPHYKISEIKPLGHNIDIENYLRHCGIWQQAKDILYELYYFVEDDSGRRKEFFAAGWLNELGHWHVAAPNFTGCLSHPALTIIPGTTNEVWLFETMFDYLRKKAKQEIKAQIIILNGPHLLQAGLAIGRTVERMQTFFNNPLPET